MREHLVADRGYYVSPSGNDANDGTVGAPWLTLQRAWDAISDLDLGRKKVTVQVADGTYSGIKCEGVIPGVRSIDAITFLGNTEHADRVVIRNPSGHAVEVSHGAFAKFDGFTVEASLDGVVTTEGAVGLGTIVFGRCGWAHMQAVAPRSRIALSGTYYIFGNAEYHVLSEQAAFISLVGSTCYYQPNLVFKVYAYVDQCGMADFTGATWGAPWGGPAPRGKKFEAVSCGIVSVNGFPKDFLPGDRPGSAATGGQYV